MSSILQVVAGDWYRGSGIGGVVFGCPDEATFKAKIRAPTLYPTICSSHIVALNYGGAMNINNIVNGDYASPLDHDSLIVDSALILGERESVNLITG